MKKKLIAIALLAFLSYPMLAQHKLSAGAGYNGNNVSVPGFVLEFEYEKFYKDDFSSPLRADLTFITNTNYDAIVLDFHKGFRKYFSNGLLIEQSVGAGLMTSFYKSEYLWSYDDYTNVVFHYGKPTIGFTPSVALGVGYNLTNNTEKNNLIWLRPKVYWNLGVRGLNMPYFALQIGYTHNFKTKHK